MTDEEIKSAKEEALQIAAECGGIDGAHHKQWVIDQMVRALTGCPMVQRLALDCNSAPYWYSSRGESEEYEEWVEGVRYGEDGPATYDWDEGIIP